ncbi:MAG: glycosyltransferase [Microbacterium enclense]
MTAFTDGRQFALTWGIPRDFGGLTAAMLQRSRLFDLRGGRAVHVLTCDDREDVAVVADELERRRALSERVEVTNLWEWLREHDLAGRAVRAADGFAPLPATAVEERSGGVTRRRVRTDTTGAVQQIDHLRADGTLAASDRRDVPRASGKTRRVVVTCDREGTPTAAWHGVRELYRAWLDRLTDGEPSFLLVDSKAMARFAADYRRPHVVVVHVVHGSHLTDDGSAIRASRAEVFRRLGAFDAVVFCTRRQASDARRQAGPLPLLLAVPHPVRVADDVDITSPRRGTVVLARLAAIKRVEDAVDALRTARRARSELTLDVYGDGPERSALEHRADSDPSIRFHGFDPAATEALRTASTLLMTSRSEAFSLVVAEAMASGCLPIAYDVPYGPRELIAHGRTGWLVPPGDTRALSETIARADAMDDESLARMRAAAVARARRYGEEEVLAMWDSTLRRAARRQRARRATWRFREVLRRRLGVR